MTNKELVLAILNNSRASEALQISEDARAVFIKRDERMTELIFNALPAEIARGIVDDMGGKLRHVVAQSILKVLAKEDE